MARSTAGRLLVTMMLVIGVFVLGDSAPPSRGEEPPPLRYLHLVYFDDEVNLDALESWLPDMQVVESYDSFLLARLSEEEVEFLEFEDVLVKDMGTMGTIDLMGASFDPLVEIPELPSELTAPATGDGWYLVQFVGPVKAAWRSDLMAEASAMEVISATTYLAFLTEAARVDVAAMPKVRWVGPYHPGYRVPSDLAGSRFAIQFFAGQATNGIPALETIGLVVDETESSGNQAVVDGTVAEVEVAVLLDEVFSASPATPHGLAVENARAVVGADSINDLGLIGRPSGGTTQIVALFDTGYYRDHEVFGESGKVSHVNENGLDDPLYGDFHGHGTATASIVLGDAPENSQFLTYNNHDGLAIGCKLIIERVQANLETGNDGGSFADELDDAYTNGARTSSIQVTRSADYAKELDEEVWENRDHIILVAAGNDGEDGRPANQPFTFNSLTPIALAKNAISVGCCSPQSDYDMAPYSSYGPATPSSTQSEASGAGRIKPDIVTPGHNITTASMWDFPNQWPRNLGSYYNQFAGTSAATPIAAAGAALVREYFMDGHHPDGARTPSAALVKAVLINGAQEITGDMQESIEDYPAERWPNSYQGWGLMDLDRSCYFSGDSWKTMVWDDPQALDTGAQWAAQFNVGSGTSDVKVTLVWTDPPTRYRRIPNSDSYWMDVVNNLDLRVVDPKGKVVFWGNNFTGTNPGYSVSKGAANDVDNVEGVHLVPHRSYKGALPTGDYTVFVTARSIASAGTTFAVVIGGESIGPPQGGQQTGSIAIMGDYKGRMEKLLTRHGYTVRSYKNDTSGYQSLLNDFSIGPIDVAILNNVKHTPGVTDVQTNGLVTTGAIPQSWRP